MRFMQVPAGHLELPANKWEEVTIAELVVGDTIIYNEGEPESVVTYWYQYEPTYNVKLGLDSVKVDKVNPAKVVRRIKRRRSGTLNIQLAVEAADKLSDLLKQQHAIKSSPNDMVDLTGGWGMISKEIALRAVKDAIKAQLAEITKLIK